MEDNVVQFEKPKKTMKERLEDFRAQAKVKIGLTVDWCREHKEVLLVIVPAVLGAAGEVGKAAINAKDHREARALEEKKLRSVYDRSAGMYLRTTRELNNDDFRGMQELKDKDNKMSTGKALDKMGLLE